MKDKKPLRIETTQLEKVTLFIPAAYVEDVMSYVDWLRSKDPNQNESWGWAEQLDNEN